MSSMEDKIINRLDSRKPDSQAEKEVYGREAEKVAIEFIQSISGLRVRSATPAEDSGLSQIGKDPAIDAVGYLDEKPAIVFQITNSDDKRVQQEKTRDLLERPFIRLLEMAPQDTAIPRVLVFLDRVEVWAFMGDTSHNIKKHPRLRKQITDGVLNSLRFDLMKTKNPKEQELIQKLMTQFTNS